MYSGAVLVLAVAASIRGLLVESDRAPRADRCDPLIAGPGRARAPSGLRRWLSSSDHSRRARGFLGRSGARGVFRLLRDVSGGESPFASVAVRWPRRASSARTTAAAQRSTGTCRLSRTGGRIAPTEVSCPRRMMVILQLPTAARAQLPRRCVRPCDRHAARAIAMIGAVTASCCQLSPRSGLRRSRPSAMPQTSSSARAASVYGIDSPGTGSSRQASPSQR